MTTTDQQTAPRQKPFAGVRVIDISNFLAAPMSAMFLADFGADMIKVEQPGKGDEVRYWGRNKDGVGLYFKILGRGKKSVTADLRTPLGTEIVKRLVKDADILIENYRTGTLEKWGIGPDVLQEINPGLIIVRITGFGQTGPYKDRPGFGTLAEAFSGFVHINGEPDRPPLLPGFGLADSTTGLMAAFLASAALHEKRRSGKGQIIDLAIYETLFTLLGPQAIDYDQLGEVQHRQGSRLPFTAPRNTYRTKDGKWVSMAGSAQSTFERICAALDVPGLIEDPASPTTASASTTPGNWTTNSRMPSAASTSMISCSAFWRSARQSRPSTTLRRFLPIRSSRPARTSRRWKTTNSAAPSGCRTSSAGSRKRQAL